MTAPGGASDEGAGPAGSNPVLDLLGKVPLFQFLGPQELAAVASSLALSTHDAGTVIFNKDEPGTTLEIVAAGSVKKKIYICLLRGRTGASGSSQAR